MHATTRMTDEWPLEMNSQRDGADLALRILWLKMPFARFDRVRQSLEGPQNNIHRSGDGGWKITRDPMPREQHFDRGQRLGGIVHDVISGAAVKVKIDKARRYHAISEIGDRNSAGDLSAATMGNLEDAALLDEH